MKRASVSLFWFCGLLISCFILQLFPLGSCCHFLFPVHLCFHSPVLPAVFLGSSHSCLTSAPFPVSLHLHLIPSLVVLLLDCPYFFLFLWYIPSLASLFLGFWTWSMPACVRVLHLGPFCVNFDSQLNRYIWICDTNTNKMSQWP